MVKNQQSKRQKSIKSKLLAAVCMLLVSCIMMVSSTYAWFTLSTAPEVTGITTSVGANGNLEMALQPIHGNSTEQYITSGTGDSMYGNKSAYEANLTWGNLVDLKDNSHYGLNKIVLYPSALNTVEGTYNNAAATLIATSPLATPKYGADGRVIELATTGTFTGVYDGEGFSNSYTVGTGDTATTAENPYGVRAVGSSSGMSDRELAYRAALSAASNAVGQAKRVAANSLKNNGAKLADIAIKHATTDDDADTYSKSELQPLQTIVNELLGYDTGDAHTTGALEYIEEALIQYALATALAKYASDDNYDTYVDDFEAAELSTLKAIMESYDEDVVNAAVTSGITTLTATVANVNAAKATFDGIQSGTKESLVWSDFNEALYKLADADAMQVNGIAVAELKGNWLYKDGDTLPAGYRVSTGENGEQSGYVYDDENEIVSNMGRLVDAVLSDGLNLILASNAGVYADIADFCGDYTAEVTLSKIEYGGMKVKNLDATMTTKTNQNPTYLANAATAVGTYQDGASDSATSYITDYYGYIIDLAFRTNVADSYLQLQVEATDRIYGEDGTNTNTMGHGATMTFTSDSDQFSGVKVQDLMKSIRIVFFDTDSRAILGYARLDANSVESGTDGSQTMELYMCDEDGVAAENSRIMALEQNTIHELSILVYLDGNSVTNADVANAANSMTGSMNLQFSSSATLVPMNYSDLKSGDGGVGDGNDDDDEPVNLTNVTLVDDSNTGVTLGTKVYDGSNIAIKLNGYTNQTVTIKVGDAAAVSVTPVTVESVTGITYAASGVTADTAIVVTVTPGT